MGRPRAQVITAAGEGSTAATAINADLVQEDVQTALRGDNPDRQPLNLPKGLPLSDHNPERVPPVGKHELAVRTRDDDDKPGSRR